MREISFRTWPRHFSHTGIDVTDVISLGRRVREMSIIPASAACAARKRKSMECAFSELRAMVAGVGGYRGGGCLFGGVEWCGCGCGRVSRARRSVNGSGGEVFWRARRDVRRNRYYDRTGACDVRLRLLRLFLCRYRKQSRCPQSPREKQLVGGVGRSAPETRWMVGDVRVWWRTTRRLALGESSTDGGGGESGQKGLAAWCLSLRRSDWHAPSLLS